MSTVVAPRASLSTPSALEPEFTHATCPSCHVEDPSMTNQALSAGADWQCSRCGSRWDAVRLAAVTAYDVWLAAHTATGSAQR